MVNTRLSSSGFRDAFSRIINAVPAFPKAYDILRAACIETPLGAMIAIANEEALYLLEFLDRGGLERTLVRLQQKTKYAIIPGMTPLISEIGNELRQYFEGKLKMFHTPLFLLGSPFQNRVWEALRKIPHGQTQSYAELAAAIGKPSACRAVAQANRRNLLPIIIPCHRVISANGKLGGYASGLPRKEWLINHERNYAF